jgi:S-adenosylmethionine:tRNA ribosyltransferase-isomerase
MNKLNIEDIHPSQFHYDLPKEMIADEPLSDRSASRLLHYHRGDIEHTTFKDITQLLPVDAHLIFNDTRVIPARLVAQKSSGAHIEIFLLEPISPSSVMEEAMLTKEHAVWSCMIGNAKKWKLQTSLTIYISQDKSLLLKRVGDAEVSFTWSSDEPFSSMIEAAGNVPLPPYINRQPTDLDIPRYQTVYSQVKGAVAAPTAGLHFTDEIMRTLHKQHQIDYLTLHVSAGTFQPIKTSASNHPMHREEVLIAKTLIENLLKDKPVIAIGTTSMRTLESLYWYGVKLIQGQDVFEIEKMYPYQHEKHIDKQTALSAVLTYMEKNSLNQIRGYTEIFIFPGYEFKICQGLITNFHLPGTTLMMLVAAFIGADWESVYSQALSQNYRFLSYGDSSLLIPKNSTLAS